MTEIDNKNGGSKDDNLRSLIESGGDIAGGAVGSAIGFVIGGPGGAAIGGASGAAASAAIRKIGTEATEKVLGNREKTRVGGAIAIAAANISARTQRGERLRDDGYFEKRHNGRSDAEEVAESVLLKSQREAEERKIPYLAYLVGNIAFDRSISGAMAHQIIKAAESLTYRQLCIMKISALVEKSRLRGSDYRGQQSFPKEQYQVLYECLDLYLRALVNFDGGVAFGPTDVNPRGMTIQGLGADLFNQMGLATIPDADLDPIVKQLS